MKLDASRFIYIFLETKINNPNGLLVSHLCGVAPHVDAVLKSLLALRLQTNPLVLQRLHQTRHLWMDTHTQTHTHTHTHSGESSKKVVLPRSKCGAV